MRLGPDTASSVADAGYRHCSGYNFDDGLVRAFSHTRLVGAGVTDLGERSPTFSLSCLSLSRDFIKLLSSMSPFT